MSCKTTCVEQKDSCSCGNKILQDGSHSIAADFEACLPFGGRLYSVNGAVRYEAPSNPPRDGVYTNIVVHNGCIISAGQADISTYTSAPCAPVPSDCHGSDSGSSSSGGYTVIRGSDGVSVIGNGTVNNPYVISLAGTISSSAGDFYVVSGNSAIAVDTDGAECRITHETPIEDGTTVMGMRFNRYGHLIGYTAPTEVANIRQIQTGTGLVANTDIHTGICTINLAPTLHKLDPIKVGGYLISFDEYGRIYNVEAIVDPSTPTLDAGKPVCHVISRNGIGEDTFSINLGSPSQLKVSASCAGSQQLSIAIDGTAVTLFGQQGHWEGIPNTTYAAGAHTIRVSQWATDDSYSTYSALITVEPASRV